MSNNDTSNPYGYREGLPGADDYHPAVLGTAKVSQGPAVETFEDYGLEMVPLELNDNDTGRRMILRNGEFIADVSDRYNLFPNEKTVEVANQVASDMGAVPFNDFDGDWYIELDDHVFQDQDCRRVHALYAWDDPVDIGGGDTVQMGFAVHDSIDQSLSFQVGLFTFRHACANMVEMGVDSRGMSFDDRDVVQHFSHKHTSGLDTDLDALRGYIEQVLTRTDDIVESYRGWQDQLLPTDDALGLMDRLPSQDLPEWMQEAEEALEEIEEDETEEGESLSQQRRADFVRAEMPEAETRWSTYNDVTEAIWHDDGTNDSTKSRKFKKTHRVMKPAEGIQ